MENRYLSLLSNSFSVVPFVIVLALFITIGGFITSDGWSTQLEWHEVGPGGGGAVRDFAFDPLNPDRVYITSDMVGVFTSNDAGDHWQWTSYGAATKLGGIAVDPTDSQILYSVGPKGIFQSQDKAKHWTLIYTKDNGYHGVNGQNFGSLKKSIFGTAAQSVSVSSAGVVYASTVIGDIITSRNKGKSFARISVGGKSPVKNIIPLEEHIIVAALLREGIYLSEDDGISWVNTLSPSNGSLLALTKHPVENNILFALIGKHSSFSSNPNFAHHYPAYLYQSKDSGKTWKLKHVFEQLAIRKDRRIMDVSQEGTIIILSASGPMRSPDEGETWTQSRIEGKNDDDFIYRIKGRPTGAQSVYADYRTSGRWYMTDMLAAFRSDDDGKTWQYKVKGLREQAYRFVKVNPGRSNIIIASDMDHGLIRSSDSGITWRDIVIEDPFEECDQLRFMPSDETFNELYAFFVLPYPFIAKSTDAGDTWTVLRQWKDKRMRSMNGFCLTREGKLPAMYVGEPNVGIWKSKDNGKSWIKKNKGLPRPDEISYIQFLESDERGYLYVGIASEIRGGGIFSSKDGGESWFQINNGLENPFVRSRSFEIDPNNPDVLWVGAGEAVYRSNNRGKRWEKRIGHMLASAILVEPENSDNVYVASYTGGGIVEQYSSGIYKSVDGGNYFYEISGNLFRTVGSSYRVFDLEYGWRGPGGIWAAPDGGGLIYTTGN